MYLKELKNKGDRLIMEKNTKIDFVELERLAEFGEIGRASCRERVSSPV